MLAFRSKFVSISNVMKREEDYEHTNFARRIPWPGPPPWVVPLASELVSVANAETGALRESLMQVAGRIAEAGLGVGVQRFATVG